MEGAPAGRGRGRGAPAADAAAASAGAGGSIFSLGGRGRGGAGRGRPKALGVPPWRQRLNKEMADGQGIWDAKQKVVQFTEGVDKPDKFRIIHKPDEGIWSGSTMTFDVSIPPDYPQAPPIMKCLTKVWHPNIDLNGNICLNILYLPPKGEWTPVLDVEAVYYGLVFLFAEPNPEDPLNKEAAAMMKSNLDEFTRAAQGRGHRYSEYSAAFSR